MFRFVTVSVLVVSALAMGQSAVRSQRDVPTAGEAAQAAQSSSSVPQQINHQGVVSVSGVRFNGIGCFKFVIVAPPPLADDGRNLWSNDGSIDGTVGGVPATFCSLPVTDGVYSIRLGDTDLACMQLVPSSVFNVNNARLRIWFSDDCTEERFQQLTPDQKLTSAPYAHRTAVMPPIGSIIAWHKDFTGVPELPDGWLECDGVMVIPDGPLAGQTMPNLNNPPPEFPGAEAGMFLRGSTASGARRPYATKKPAGFSIAANDHDHRFPLGGNSGACDFSRAETSGSNHQGCTTSDPRLESVNHNHSISGWDGETRPVNMFVVWIMRVK